MILDKRLMKIRKEDPEGFRKRFDETAENCRLAYVPKSNVLDYLRTQYASKGSMAPFSGFMEGCVEAMSRPAVLALAASGVSYIKMVSDMSNKYAVLMYTSVTTGTILGLIGLHYISDIASRRKIRPLETFFDWFYNREDGFLPSYSKVKEDAERNKGIASL